MDLTHLSMSEALSFLDPENQVPSRVGHDEGPMVPTESASKMRAVKRRASRACSYCRYKKIKCSLVKSGTPCNTCQLDEVECVVTKSRRNQGRRVATTVADEHTLTLSPNSVSVILDELHALPDEVSESSDSISPKQFVTSTGSIDVAQDILYHENGSSRPSIAPASTSAQRNSASVNSATRSSRDFTWSVSQLPNHFRGPSPGIASDDLVLLTDRGVFELPRIGLQNELLQKYSEYVHPLLPLLDLGELLESVYSNDGHTQISLMLFYAIMSAAASFADLHVLLAAGFADRKAARKAFFQKAKLLYNCDYETERISLVQALCLMSYWYETPDDRKDPSYWVGECLSYAYTMGLHKQTNDQHFDPKNQRLRRRLWWCCYMRDQLITLSQRKPRRINVAYGVPVLAIEDYDTQPIEADMLCPFAHSPALADPWTRTIMAKLCVEKVKLCICIDHILTTHYSETLVNMARPDLPTERVVMLTSRRVSAENPEIIKCEQLLVEWNANLPLDCYFRASSQAGQEIHHLEVLSVHRSVLNMLYLTAVNAFHRPHIGSAAPSRPSRTFDLQQLSLRKVKEAAVEVTAMAVELRRHDATRFLPPIGVTLIMPALITHLLEIKADPVRDNPSLGRFRQGVEALQTLCDAYWSAEYAYSFIDASVQRSNIEIADGEVTRRMQGIADLMGLTGPSKPQSVGDLDLRRAAGRSEVLPSVNIEGLPAVRNSDGLESFIDFDAFADCFGPEGGLNVGLEDLWTTSFLT